MCRPPRISANLDERTTRRSVPAATFVGCVRKGKLASALPPSGERWLLNDLVHRLANGGYSMVHRLANGGYPI